MNVQDRSVKEIRCAVVKNENESHDANVNVSPFRSWPSSRISVLRR
jgi:hypothetical protein